MRDYVSDHGSSRLYRRPIDVEGWPEVLRKFFPYNVWCAPFQQGWMWKCLEKLKQTEVEIINEAATDFIQDQDVDELYIIGLIEVEGRPNASYQDNFGDAARIIGAELSISERKLLLRLILKYPKVK